VCRVRVTQALSDAATALQYAQVPSPRVDAELLAAHVLGISRGRLALISEFTVEQLGHFRDLVNRRAERVPLQYITGTAPFRHLSMEVGEGVFVPRPETEVLVEWALTWLGRRPGAVVVDLCAGSGAIAASIAVEGPPADVYAVECHPGALRWLRANADTLNLTRTPITVIVGDATDPATLAGLDGSVDLVLTNPPYVPRIGAAGLPAEVTVYDPEEAVFGGTDGLDVIRPLLPRVAALLRPGGAFALEHDETHAYVVPALVRAHGGFDDVEVHHDLARRARFTTATRSGSSPGSGTLAP
jgi:release factor glutamine methyltransferase